MKGMITRVGEKAAAAEEVCKTSPVPHGVSGSRWLDGVTESQLAKTIGSRD